jgi:iron-sulfur cluster repair protein YtfE (RIC family)
MTSGRVTALFHREHAELALEREAQERVIDALRLGQAADPAATMREVLRWLRDRVLPHDAWEERFLFPAADKHSGSGAYPFTATLRRQHKLMAVWVDDLAGAFAALDGTAFARRAERLVGLLAAHLDAEEAVLLPLIEATMSDLAIQRDILVRVLEHQNAPGRHHER